MQGHTKKDSKPELVLETSLQNYFLDHLGNINSKSTNPLPREIIVYSSAVMDRMIASDKYFDTTEGKVRDKILGIKLLEAQGLANEERKSVLRDIGDTALLLCGYFHESMNNKILDVGYYQNLGRTSYYHLNSIAPEAFNMQSFYLALSESFNEVTQLIGIIADKLDTNCLSDDFLIFVNDPKKIAS